VDVFIFAEFLIAKIRLIEHQRDARFACKQANENCLP